MPIEELTNNEHGESFFGFDGDKSLFSDERIYIPKTKNGENPRLSCHEDEIRITSSSAFRRLQDKAQLYPLEKFDYTRTRLTHSLEVAAIANDIATETWKELVKKGIVNFNDAEGFAKFTKFVSYCRNASLWHDIGNPPFGHFGEESIHLFYEDYLNERPSPSLNLNGKTIAGFSSLKEILNSIPDNQAINDLQMFDGNVQSFRYAAKLQDNGSSDPLGLTYSTLGGIVKYPFSSASKSNKYGYYLTEKLTIKKLEELHMLKEGASCNPIALIMESADDVGNVLADVEDGLKKGCISESSFFQLVLSAQEKYSNMMEIADSTIKDRKEFINTPQDEANELIRHLVEDLYPIAPKYVQKDIHAALKLNESDRRFALLRITNKIFTARNLLNKFKEMYNSQSNDNPEIRECVYFDDILSAKTAPSTHAGSIEKHIYESKSIHKVIRSWLHFIRGYFISNCAMTFVFNYDSIMNAKYIGETVDKNGNITLKRRELIKDSNCAYIHEFLREFIKEYIYTDPEKTLGEIEGGVIIKYLLKTFSDSIQNVQLVKDGKRDDAWRLKDTNRDSKTILLLSKNFLDVFYNDYESLTKDVNDDGIRDAIELYLKFRFVTDCVAGCTDSYAQTLYGKLKGIN